MPKKKSVATSTVSRATATGARPRLSKLRVSNFRCIGSEPVEIDLDDIVVLVGPNNAGKTAILRAYEVVMRHGSEGGELTIEDFPDGKQDASRCPTIEVETVVFEKTAPGERWVRTEPKTGEMFVRERWVWEAPGPPKKVGWNVELGDWDPKKGPWGAPNVAQAYRPQPHYISAFQKPEEQAGNVVKLLSKAITEKAKEMSKARSEDAGSDGPSDFEMLMESIKKLRVAIADDAAAAVANVEEELSSMIAKVFPDYSVTFDARAEDDVEKALNLYKPSPLLKMGPSAGFQSTLERQGSGACRTLIWAALKILSEHTDSSSPSPWERPHLLLMDEPEICLHPDAIREARRVLYDLPSANRWQVMITTHSPVFIDLSRDNTSVARVERLADGDVRGTTIFRPSRAKLDDDDRVELKLLNICDPYVAEFFFGGRTVLVEGDTEYTAFRHVISCEPDKYSNVHVVRARGKSCLVALCKILNQFDKGYAILHDSDFKMVPDNRTKGQRANPAWAENLKILGETKSGRDGGRVRLVASLPNFEHAFFGEGIERDKPYWALARLKKEEAAYQRIATLLDCLLDPSVPVPKGAKSWHTIEGLEAALAESVRSDA